MDSSNEMEAKIVEGKMHNPNPKSHTQGGVGVEVEGRGYQAAQATGRGGTGKYQRNALNSHRKC